MTESTLFTRPVFELKTIPGKFDEDAEFNLKTSAQLLDTSVRNVRMMLETGVLPRLSSNLISAIASRTIIVPSGAEQPIIRTGKEGFDDADQRPTGYSDSMSDADVLEANRRWWKIAPEKALQAYYLPIACGGMIVALLGVDELEESTRVATVNKNGSPSAEVRHSFKARLLARYDAETDSVVNHTTEPEERDVASMLVGHLQRSVSGGAVAYL